MRTPPWTQSVRFRLSLAYSLSVFAAGSAIVAGMYFWLSRRFDRVIELEFFEVIHRDPVTGAQTSIPLVPLINLEMWRAQQVDREIYHRSLDLLQQASLFALFGLFVISFGSGWLLSGWTLQPIKRMARVAGDISARDLTQRIDLKGPDDEMKALADTFDEMLDRLNGSFEDQRRFVQDASHELRNPLAVAQANLELVIDDPVSTPEQMRSAVEVAHRANHRIGRIVEDLLTQARQRVPEEARGPLDLAVLVAEMAKEHSAAAGARSIRIVVDPTTDAVGSAIVNVHGPALRRAVANLILNAVRLAPERSQITLRTATDDGWGLISVTDQGPGIPPENHEKVFERFWRADEAGKGVGLGLSIVQQIAHRHGGTVELDSEVGKGSIFTIKLPFPVVESAVLNEPAISGGPPRS